MRPPAADDTKTLGVITTNANRRAVETALKCARATGTDHLVSVCLSPADPIDPIQWLASHHVRPGVYWRSRWSSEECGGLGAAATVRESGTGALLRALAESSDLLSRVVSSSDIPISVGPRLFGGASFDPDAKPPGMWTPFDDALFVLPEAAVVTHGVQSHLIVTARVSAIDSLPDVLTRLEDCAARYGRELSEPLPPLPSGVVVNGEVSYPRWEQMLGSALTDIASGRLQKVVLSRSIQWQPAAPVSVWSLADAARGGTEGAYSFALQPSPDAAFLSITPERLVRLSGRDVETDCLAGTVARSSDPERDKELSRELLESLKDRREHGFVVEGIVEALRGVCTQTAVGGDPWLMRLPTVQHLVTTARARLREGILPAEVISRLHPTPAVGGTPRDRALETIRRLEPDGRGWYAGPVGWISRDAAEFAVAIRSALITADAVHVFAGAGIVAGSSPDREWAETDAKAQAILRLIHC